MGPNLTELFEYAGKEPITDDELDRAQAANMVLFDLFQTHGEALIKALEMAQPSVCSDCCSIGEHANECVKISTLLAQLEPEAQP